MTIPAKARADLPQRSVDVPRSTSAESGQLDALATQLDRAARRVGGDGIAIVSIPVAALSLESAFAPRGGLLWRPRTGPAIAGGGAAVTLRADNGGRFDDISNAARELFARVEHVAHPAAAAPAPRLFGGFSFCPGSADEAPWTEFGDAQFWLPRWTLGSDGRGSWMSLAVERPGDPRSRAAALDLAESLLGARSTPARDIRLGAVVDEVDRKTWRRRVESIRSEIAAGHTDKIVAARRSTVDLAARIDPRQVVARLFERFADCFVFAMCPGDDAFVGATPERLIERRGERLLSEAIAGSISPHAGGAALLSSAKDRGEQEIVVRAIERALAPLCSKLIIPGQPGIRELRNVLHLETRIEGRLRSAIHVLDLVRALHPTPAVGGVPNEHAVRWIERTESDARGWYAAPVGWFDAAGDGEFAVAIRSGLLSGRRAYVYAGAGIVRDSDPQMEYEETGLKQRAVLDALGIRSVEAAAG